MPTLEALDRLAEFDGKEARGLVVFACAPAVGEIEEHEDPVDPDATGHVYQHLKRVANRRRARHLPSRRARRPGRPPPRGLARAPGRAMTGDS
jgi:hypothetical protein